MTVMLKFPHAENLTSLRDLELDAQRHRDPAWRKRCRDTAAMVRAACGGATPVEDITLPNGIVILSDRRGDYSAPWHN